jgi:hypothetical protein
VFLPAQLAGRDANCVDQCARWKWFPQKCDAPDFYGLQVNGLIVNGGHEYDCELRPRLQKPPSKFNAGNATQMYVQHQASRLTCGSAVEKCFSR